MSRIKDLLAEGKKKLLQGMYADARLYFDEAIGDEIAILGGFLGRGTCKLTLGDMDGAENDFLIAKSMLDPKGFFYVNGSIESRIEKKGSDCIELAAMIMQYLGVIYITKKDSKKAEQALEESSILYRRIGSLSKIEENNAYLKDIPKEDKTK